MSALSGMTGFARTAGSFSGYHWIWEARSVNGKGLDVRLRLPSEVSGLDGPVKKIFTAHFRRGNMQIALELKSPGGPAAHRINTAFAEDLRAYAQSCGEALPLSDLLRVPGVVTEQPEDAAPETQSALAAAILSSAQDLASRLQEARDAEGAAIAPLLVSAIERIETLTAEARGLEDIRPEYIQQQLRAKLSVLLGGEIDDERIAQEASILAMKADICEELDRLAAHCQQGRAHLEAGSPVGRKLDFLCQEFNRETNTLCSKSSSIALTRIGLELKSVIEQFREQAANAE